MKADVEKPQSGSRMDTLETQPMMTATWAPDTLEYDLGETTMETQGEDHDENGEEESKTDDELADGIDEDECEFPQHDLNFMDVSPHAMLEVERVAFEQPQDAQSPEKFEPHPPDAASPAITPTELEETPGKAPICLDSDDDQKKGTFKDSRKHEFVC